jgi:deoxyuridine 5'-triphosphate nucleotidohydrolase
MGLLEVLSDLWSDSEEEVYDMESPEFQFCMTDDVDESFLPQKATSTDTGWDVKAAEDYVFTSFQTKPIRLGIRCFAPEGWWLELRPRSSTMAKKNLHCLYGVIDEGYENEIMLAATYIPSESSIDINHKLEIKKGERLGQIIPVRRIEAIMSCISKEDFDKLCKERGGKRGLGGFGSTG